MWTIMFHCHRRLCPGVVSWACRVAVSCADCCFGRESKPVAQSRAAAAARVCVQTLRSRQAAREKKIKKKTKSLSLAFYPCETRLRAERTLFSPGGWLAGELLLTSFNIWGRQNVWVSVLRAVCWRLLLRWRGSRAGGHTVAAILSFLFYIKTTKRNWFSGVFAFLTSLPRKCLADTHGVLLPPFWSGETRSSGWASFSPPIIADESSRDGYATTIFLFDFFLSIFV